MSNFKYILSSSGKFHHFNTARALYEKNQLLKIFSGYPWLKLKNEKLNKSYVNSQGLNRIFLHLYSKIGSRIFSKNFNKIISNFFEIKNCLNIDSKVNKFLNDNEADVLLALTSVGLISGKKMIKNDKIYICEQSSSHIIYQNDIIKEEYKEFLNKDYKVNNWFIDRTLEEFETANIILSPSSFVKKSFSNSIYLDKVSIVEFGIDNKNFFPIKGFKKNQKHFNVLFIATKSIRKGLHYLIDAFEKFKHPHKKLHVVGGETEDEDFFKKKINTENMIIYGHVNHLKLNDIINKCHVYVLPSIEDGYGLTVTQAAASGCPGIVTENTGASDFIKRNKCGFVVPIRDSNSIAEKIQTLADNKNLLEEMSHNATSNIRSQSWSDYVEKLNNIVLDYKNNKLKN